MYIYRTKKNKVKKCKCELVKRTSYYVNGTLIEAKLTYDCKCKPKVKVKKCKCRRQRTVGEVLLGCIWNS